MKNVNDNIVLVEYSTIDECPSTKKMLSINCVTRKENTILYQDLILGRINLKKIKYEPKPNKGFNKYLNNKFLYINKKGSL
jgi:hypothetical protein